MPSIRRLNKIEAIIEKLPSFQRRIKSRQLERTKKRKTREWSPNRPKRPETDDIYDEVARAIARLNESAWHTANKTGLSTATIYRMRNNKSKTGLSTTLQMALKATGGRLVVIYDEE